MIRMSVKKQITSKGMFAGWFLFGLGAYIIAIVGDVPGGLTVAGLGLGILGIRDDKE